MPEIDSKIFNDFQVEVFNRLEGLHEEMQGVAGHVLQVKTVLFGVNGEPGKLAVIDKRLDAHTRSITRIMQLLWPIIGIGALLLWIGIESVRKMLQ